MLITKYLASVKAEISPFSRSASKSTRLFLALLLKDSAKQANATKVDTKMLSGPESRSTLSVTYKDGKVINLDAGALRISELVNLINTHSKNLALKDQVS